MAYTILGKACHLLDIWKKLVYDNDKQIVGRCLAGLPKGGKAMTVYEAITLMILFGTLIVAIMSDKNTKK